MYHWILKNATTGVIIDEQTFNHPKTDYTHNFCDIGSFSLFVNASTLDGDFKVIPAGVRAVIPVKGHLFYSPNLFELRPPYGPLFNPWEYSIKFNPDSDSAIVNSYEFVFGDNSQPISSQFNIENHTYPSKLGETYHGQVKAKNNTPLLFPEFVGNFDLTPIPPPTSDFNIRNASSGEIITKGPAPLNVLFESLSWWPYLGVQYPYYPDKTKYGWNWTTGEYWNHLSVYYDSHHIPNPDYPYVITYSDPGLYNITHYIADNFTDGSGNYGFYSNFFGNHTTKQLIVYEPIVPDFTYSIDSCEFPLKVSFKDDSTGSHIDRWLWDFYDGTKKETPVNKTDHTYHKPDQYLVNMTGFNDTYQISVNFIKPVNVDGLFANFTYTPQVIETKKGSPVIVQYNSTSHGVDPRTLYKWEFERDGQKYQNISRNATMSYSNQGIYNVTLTVTKQSDDQCNGAKNSTTKKIRVREFLESRFSYYQIFSPDTYKVQFKDESTDTPTQRLWKFYHKDGINYDTIPDDPEPQYTYPGPGVYRVILSVVNDQGTWDHTNDFEQWITVYENIRADFTPNVTKGVSPLSVKFTDISIPPESITNWIWTFDDGTTNLTKNPEHIFRLPDGVAQKQFNVNLTVRNQTTGASNSTIKIIDVIAPLKADFIPKGKVPTNLTEGVQFTSQSTGNITGYLWDFDDKSTPSTEKNPLHKFSDYGLYNVTLTVSNDYYQTSNTTKNCLNITDKSSPLIIDFTADSTRVNRDVPVNFIAQIQGPDIESYFWDFGDGKNSTRPQPSHAYDLPGKYDVTLNVTSLFGNDTMTKSQYIWVKGLKPSFITIPSGWAMVNTPVTFMDTSLGGTEQWRWDFGDGTIEDSPTYMTTHTYRETRTYPISLTVKNWEGLQDTVHHEITIVNKSVPQGVDFEVPEMQYSGKAPLTVQFEDKTPAQSNVIDWFWEFGDGSNSFEQAPIHRYENPGQYTVTLTVRNENGTNEKRRVAYVVVL
jgi:PKD repeat protein